MDAEQLIKELVRDEAIMLKPYHDTVGKLTIGIGRNLSGVGISLDEAEYLCRNDIKRVVAELDEHLPWWRDLDEVRQRVLVNMGFNMGVDGSPMNPHDGLTGFTNTLDAIKNGRYEEASKRMLQSKWARQVGKRAIRLSNMMRTGKV